MKNNQSLLKENSPMMMTSRSTTMENIHLHIPQSICRRICKIEIIFLLKYQIHFKMMKMTKKIMMMMRKMRSSFKRRIMKNKKNRRNNRKKAPPPKRKDRLKVKRNDPKLKMIVNKNCEFPPKLLFCLLVSFLLYHLYVL